MQINLQQCIIGERDFIKCSEQKISIHTYRVKYARHQNVAGVHNYIKWAELSPNRLGVV